MTDRIKVYVIASNGPYFKLRWTDPTTGKRVVKSSKKTTRRDAERVAGQLEEQLNSTQATGDGSMPWHTFFDVYQHRQLAAMDDPTERWHLSKLRVFETEMKPSKLASINSIAISRYVAWLRGQGRKDVTIRGHMIALKCAVDWAKSQGYLSDVPTIPAIKLPRHGKARGRALTFWEFIRLLRAVRTVLQPQQVESWRRFLIGLWLSGLRLSEAAELSWDDPDSPRISFAEKYPTLEMDVDDDKGRSHRLLPITEDFARWLARTPQDQRTGKIFRPLGQDGQVITNETNLSRTISEFGEAANIVVNSKSGKFASAQDLRRTYGTRWAPHVHPLVLKELMRHSSLQTTEEYYIGLNTQVMAEELWKKTAKPKVTKKVTPKPDDSENP